METYWLSGVDIGLLISDCVTQHNKNVLLQRILQENQVDDSVRDSTINSQRKKDATLMGETSGDTKDESGSQEPSKRLESGNHADTNIKRVEKQK